VLGSAVTTADESDALSYGDNDPEGVSSTRAAGARMLANLELLARTNGGEHEAEPIPLTTQRSKRSRTGRVLHTVVEETKSEAEDEDDSVPERRKRIKVRLSSFYEMYRY
jgi:hypothetical protein